MSAVKSVSEYLSEIMRICGMQDESRIIVFRGESREYPTSGKPGIYREGYLDNDIFFEKSVLSEMQANQLSNGNNYLEVAVDAQHDGFPSRLLDVTFNCLVALYFAVTPYYKLDEATYDGKENGKVIVYAIKKAYCATAGNILDNYSAIIERKGFINESIFSANHKLIDHIKINQRIIAQQGAFILFQGDAWNPISKRDYVEIIIDKDFKQQLRKELDAFFGINTGTIYPEATNLVDSIIKKAKKISNTEHTIDNEMSLFFEGLEDEIEYQVKKLGTGTDEEKYSVIIELEKYIFQAKLNLEEFVHKFSDTSESLKCKCLNQNIHEFKDRYNEIIDKYDKMFSFYCMDSRFTNSKKELKIR